MFKVRSDRLERIDTGDYTREEYERFLKEIRFINRYVGDNRALRNTLLKAIGSTKQRLRILDLGAGSGELLRTIADHFGAGIKLDLVGIDLNKMSTDSMADESRDYDSISAVQGDALQLPFADFSFDYAISSLFAHHLTHTQIARVLSEMMRVSREGIYIIDLHRHPAAYGLYRIMCFVLRISDLVTEDGSLSILRGFKPSELIDLGKEAGLKNVVVSRSFPFRLVLSGTRNGLPTPGKQVFTE